MARFVIDRKRLEPPTPLAKFRTVWFKTVLSIAFWLSANLKLELITDFLAVFISIKIVRAVWSLRRSSPEWIAFALKARGFGFLRYAAIITIFHALIVNQWFLLAGIYACLVAIGIGIRTYGIIRIRKMSEIEFANFSNWAISSLNEANRRSKLN